MVGLFGYPVLSSVAYIIGCFVFSKGYFPSPKPWDAMNSSHHSVDYEDESPKLVWMIIDAFRAEFAARKDAVQFINKWEEMGHVRTYTALAEPPTVTLPRIKALTTGATPEFLDILRNYEGGQLVQDSVVRQLRRAGRRVVFYGDDTWLRLFPGHFVRHDGTHSFFVNDYTEVDNNVTRHLRAELARPDWDVLILHYLGLDHIGHLAGPFSPLITTKLAEMSAVMDTIYTALINSTTGPPPVLVVCGDHGMSEAGSHGGASAPETRVGLHIVSPAYTGHPQVNRGREVRQVDLAPTLATLLGVPVPAESVGRVIEDAVRPLGVSRLARALINNGHQLLALYRHSPSRADADVEHEVLAAAEAALLVGSIAAAERAASGAVRRMQAKLLNTASRHDPIAMGLGVLLILMTLLVSCRPAPGAVSAALAAGCLLACTAALLVVCGLRPDGRLCSADGAGLALLLLLAVTACLSHAAGCAGRASADRPVAQSQLWTPLDALLCAGTSLHLLSLGATSFIEEEHQTWYLLTSSVWLLLLTAELRRLWRGAGSARRAWLAGLLLLSTGVLRRWNQTGDKWLHLADVTDWLTAGGAGPLTSAWAAGLLLLLLTVRTPRPAAGVGAVCLLTRGLADGRLVPLVPPAAGLWAARTLYLTVATLALWPAGRRRRLGRLKLAWLLLVALLVRPSNLVVWAGCSLQMWAAVAWLRDVPHCPLTAALLLHWTGMAGYFLMGHSNSLASVDIAAGYVGVSAHSPVVAVLLTTCHTYSAPVLAALAALQLADSRGHVPQVLHALVTVRGVVLLVYCCLSAVFVHHIFVWTVFSPKLLLEIVGTVVVAAIAAIATATTRRPWK